VSRVAVCLLALLSTAALAGCAGGGKGGDPVENADFSDLDLSATSSTGVIRGVVVDDAIRPIAGVHLSVPADGGPRTTTTSEDGLFGFEGLAPGTYFISAAKPGFRPAQSSTDVVAGVAEPPIVRIQLAADASFKAPYTEQFVFDGFIECSAGAGVVVAYAYGSICSANGQLFPNDHFAESVTLSGYPQFVQSEMTWESTQALSRSLSHSFYYDDPGETDGEKDLSVYGTSPIINAMNDSVAKEYVEGLDYEAGQNLTLNQRIFTVSDNGEFGPGFAATIEQKFTVYSTVFYGYLPPEGWTFMDSGQIPPPPA
jgi:hypothetical protein